MTVCGPKLKLSIFTSAFPPEDLSFAAALVDPTNSSNTAIITGPARPTKHAFCLVIVYLLSSIDLLAGSALSEPILVSKYFQLSPSRPAPFPEGSEAASGESTIARLRPLIR